MSQCQCGGSRSHVPTRLRLGKPLPYQLADGPQVPLKAPEPLLDKPNHRDHRVLAIVSNGYPRL